MFNDNIDSLGDSVLDSLLVDSSKIDVVAAIRSSVVLRRRVMWVVSCTRVRSAIVRLLVP